MLKTYKNISTAPENISKKNTLSEKNFSELKNIFYQIEKNFGEIKNEEELIFYLKESLKNNFDKSPGIVQIIIEIFRKNKIFLKIFENEINIIENNLKINSNIKQILNFIK